MASSTSTFLLAFGHNIHGQLGIGSNLNAALPTPVPLPPNMKPRFVAAGADVTAVVTCCGRILLVGGGRGEQLFAHVALPPEADLRDAVGISATAVSVVVALQRAIVVIPTTKGGNGQVTVTPLPDTGVLEGERIKWVSSGALFTAVLTTRGRVFSTGMNAFGALGLAGQPETFTTTALVPITGLDEVQLLQCGGCHAIAVRDDGSVFGWGRNHLGQLGTASANGANVPVPTLITLPADAARVRRIACGDYQTLLVLQGGAVLAAGANQCGQLGLDPPTPSVATFTQVPLPAPCTRAASGGGYNVGHSLFATEAGVFAAGSNCSGQLGVMLQHPISAVLKRVPLAIVSDKLRLACGWRHSVVWDGSGDPDAMQWRHRLSHTTLNSIASQSSTPRFANLVIDACELIVCYLGATGDAMRLGLTCREWHHHVRHSRVWRQRLERFAPYATRALDDREANHRATGEYSYTVDWQTQLSECVTNRFKMVTNFTPPATTSAFGTTSVFARIGNFFRRASTEYRMLMIGLDAGGKTTMLYRLKLGEVTTTIPTIGFNVETVEYKQFQFTCWDVGGPDKIRPLWRHYYQNTRGVFFVVDSNDRERIPQARDELQRLVTERELADAVICVIANKQDLPNAMPPDEVAGRLGLHALRHPRWCVQGSVALTGEGLFEALDWLTAAMAAPKGGDEASANKTGGEAAA